MRIKMRNTHLRVRHYNVMINSLYTEFSQSLQFISQTCARYYDIGCVFFPNAITSRCLILYDWCIARCISNFSKETQIWMKSNLSACLCSCDCQCNSLKLRLASDFLAKRSRHSFLRSYVPCFKGMDDMVLSGASCDTFLSSGVLHRDVATSYVLHSAVGCSASEYYCHCAMSVSFPHICNEIFASAVAGLRATAQSKPHCPRLTVSPRVLSNDIYTGSCASRLRAHLQPWIHIRVNDTSESRCGTLSTGNDLLWSFLFSRPRGNNYILVRAHRCAIGRHSRAGANSERIEMVG